MRFVADPAALREFHARLVEFFEHLLAGRARVDSDLQELSEFWSGASRDTFVDDLHRTTGILQEVEERLQGLQSIVVAVLDYLEAGPTGAWAHRLAPSNGRVELSAVSSVGSAVPLTSRGGRALRRLPAAQTPTHVFDWGEADFATSFDRHAHHGHVASDYLALASRLPAVIESVLREQPPVEGVASADELRCYDAFFGSDPITLERRGGQWDVKDGRHRLMACLRLGIDPPVHIVGGSE